jgi:cyanophycinase
MRVIGDSTVTVCLAQAERRPLKEIELKPGDVADLIALRRAALARTLPPFPASEPTVPAVENGSLVIVGGGGMPREAVDKFIELAGGPESPIVVLPTALPDPLPERVGEAAMFEQAGAKNVTVLRGRKRQEVEEPKFLETLRAAKGIWFGGGRQWRFIDAYAGTKAQEAFYDVLHKGGVIGGSSAGASIQGEVLARGNPLGNQEIICEGYDRGLCFLPGAAIDQHFTQRDRFRDMQGLIAEHPQLLGIGIDEATALIVRGHVGEVLGKNNVQFFDQIKPGEDPEKNYDVVRPGQRYDLKEHCLLGATP